MLTTAKDVTKAKAKRIDDILVAYTNEADWEYAGSKVPYDESDGDEFEGIDKPLPTEK